MEALDKLNLRWSYMMVVIVGLLGAIVLALTIFGGGRLHLTTCRPER